MGEGYGSGLGGGVDGIEGGYTIGVRKDAYGMGGPKGMGFGSGANGVEGGTSSSCDTRKGYDGNPDCETGKRCVPTIMNLGECRTAQLETSQPDASFFGCHGRKITLKTQYRDARYLRALPDQHRVNANGTSNDDGIQFEVEDLGALPRGARKIALKSIYGKYLTAKRPAMGPLESYPVSNVTAHSTWIWKGATFEVKHNANNLYWFKTAWQVESNGRNESRYLLPYTNGYIRGDGTSHDLRRWAKFTPECVEGFGAGHDAEALGGGYGDEAQNGVNGMRGGYGSELGGGVNGIGEGYEVGVGNGNISAQKCEIEDMDGNCIAQCFGGFATGVREDEKGNLIQVCFCKGQQCNVDPCDECARKAQEKGVPFTCPCPNL